MGHVIWDEPGKRTFETGVDRGVLYLMDGTAAAWNGLISVTERFEVDTTPVYYDGRKIHELVMFGDFAATLSAFTYPEEFLQVEGHVSETPGTYITSQKRHLFHLTYRTRVGNDLEGADAGYKLHFVYNATAVPQDRSFGTLTPDPNAIEMEWDITTIPEDIEGYRPTSHIVIDSRDYDPMFLHELEELMYGFGGAEARMPTIAELLVFIRQEYEFVVTDHGDGTWTIFSPISENIQSSVDDDSVVIIVDPNKTTVDANSYIITDKLF